MMATTRQPERVRTVSPHHRFKKLGSEEVHTIESYERTIHGTPYSDPKREFSTNQYTERRTYGRDENGEIVVKIEKDPKDPVRPVSPVRPISPAGGHSYDSNNQQQQLLKPLPHVDILPLHIPRAKSTPSPRSLGSFNDQNSPKSAQSYGHSPRSGRSSGFGSAGTPGRGASPAGSNISANNGSGIPMKKVIRKTRLVSIHDGRPVSPYVETVTYEPVIKLPPPSRTTIIRDSGEDYTSSDENNDRKQQHKNRNSFGSRKLHYSEDMETIPFRQRRSSLNHENFYERENNNNINEGFYGTPGSSYRRQNRSSRTNNASNIDFSRHQQPSNLYSDSESRHRHHHHHQPQHQHRRRSHSHANNTNNNDSSNNRRKSRDEGAYIMENPMYMAY